ncbi:MAG: tRNA pseudouridine(38-40) synthase TruA [Deltaproteobacteria bacterium]|nr:tRNA pseudouridine(38-40) synthase TruA [Deltaproteobacteria bacterium]
MARTIKLTIEYDGTDFHGWQAQPGLRTVQGELEAALRRITREERCTRAAGRTDAGVHAVGQVVSFETERDVPLLGLHKGLCSLTPPDLSILRAEEAPPGFDARRSALGKHYLYRFLDAICPSATRHRFTHWVARPLDADAMARAATHLVGRHDFHAFQASDDPRQDSVRTVSRVEVTRRGDEVVCSVYGDGFLKNMVRIMMGTLMLVGLGKKTPDWVAEVRDIADRKLAGPTAPARGLCLVEVFYPDPAP